jgi:hypothetical protein
VSALGGRVFDRVGSKKEITMGKIFDIEPLIGVKHGRLTIKSADGPVGWKTKARVVCVCDCGKEKSILLVSVLRGTTQSCGCYRNQRIKESIWRHGLCDSRTYGIWNGVIQRCANPKRKRFSDYGGRGITVCEKWSTFQGFFEDMGHPPTKRHSLERKDNNGGYSLENCVWATPQEQARNRRDNRMLACYGRTQCLEDWAIETGIDKVTIFNRIKLLGWSEEKAISTPVRGMKRMSNGTVKGVLPWQGVMRCLISTGGSFSLYEEEKTKIVSEIIGWDYVVKKTAKRIMQAMRLNYGKLKRFNITCNQHKMVAFSLPDVLTV